MQNLLQARTIAIANHKGGVGKTTTASTLGSILSRAGLRVLLVDLDAQCNLTDSYLKTIDDQTVYTMMTRRESVTPTHIRDNFDIIPSEIGMSAVDSVISGQLEREKILRETLEPLKGDYDIIFLDCPPSLGLVTLNALVAANELYVPISPEIYPLQGLVKLEEVCTRVAKSLNPGISITGIIVTKYNPIKVLFRDVDKILHERYEGIIFNTRIRENVKLAECPMVCQDIIEYAPESNGAKDYIELAKEILARLEKTDENGGERERNAEAVTTKLFGSIVNMQQ